MDLDMRKLRYFVAVAERLHFGRAAAALYITQPALSRQIHQFEKELGVELLKHNSRQVSLTLAGKRLAEDGARLLTESEAAIAGTPCPGQRARPDCRVHARHGHRPGDKEILAQPPRG
jgi:DNA-binding transcriptional LysR family regulator